MKRSVLILNLCLLILVFLLAGCSGTGPEDNEGKLPVRGNGPTVVLTTGTSEIVRLGNPVSILAKVQNDGEQDLKDATLQIKPCAGLSNNNDKVLLEDIAELRSGYVHAASLDGLLASVPDSSCYIQANLCYLYKTVAVQDIKVNPLFTQKVT